MQHRRFSSVSFITRPARFRRSGIARAVALAALAAHAPGAHADESAQARDRQAQQRTTEAPRITEEMVVSAHRLTIDLPTAIAARVLTDDAIERARVGSLAELLQRQPGLYVTDAFNDGTQTSVSMRGFGGNAGANALVVVDGRELNQADLSTPDLDSLALGDIARIELLSGASAVRYGDQSTGGVVFLSTHRAGEGHSLVRAATGSDGRRELDAVYDTTLLGTGVRVSAKRHRTDGARDGAEADKTDLLARLSRDVGDGALDVEWQQVEQDRVALGALTRSQRRADRRQSGSILETDARTRNARIAWQQPFGAHRFELDVFRTRFDSQAPSSSPTFGDSLTQLERDQIAFDPRLLLRFDALAITLGADIDRHDVKFGNDSSLFGSSGSHQKLKSNGVWASVAAPVAPDVWVEAGTRYSHVDTRADGFSGDSTIAQRIDERATSWDLGAHWQASDAWQLRARVASGFRLPKADEQLSVFSGFNPLRTQTAVSYELTADYAAGPWRGHLNLYRVDLRHEIDFDPVAGFFGENVNLGATRHTGFDADVTWEIDTGLTLGADLAWVQARQNDGGDTIPFVPKRQAGAFAAWQAAPWIDLRVEAHYVGPRYAIGDFANVAGEQGGYTTVDAAAALTWRDLTLTLRADNLFDRDYDSLVSYVTFLGPDDRLTFQPDAGRRLLATLTWRP